jgi:two-component system nitrate/nitrite response regulator NarL
MRRSDTCACEGTGSALKIVIASDVRFVRESLGQILSGDDTITVIGECPDSAQLLTVCQDLQPDMVLLDASVQDGLTEARRLRETSTGLRVVVFAIREAVESVLVWAEAGVAGYIPSSAAAADLRALVTDIGAGKQACSDLVAGGLLRRIAGNAAAPHDVKALTPRELEIVRLISTGLSNKEIARRLNIGLATTKSHVHNALGKLNVRRRGQVSTWIHARSPLA